MPIVVSDPGGGDFKICPAGNHIAVCNMVVDLGIQDSNFGPKHKVYIRWEIPNERIEWEKDGEKHEGPMIIGQFYTASLSQKANLRQDLASWRGRDFTKDELEGFDVANVCGAPCMLNVVHNTDNPKRTYANVASIAPLPKGMSKPKAESELLTYGPGDPDIALAKLPEWIQETLKKQIKPDVVDQSSIAPESDIEFDDDLPFSHAL